MTLYTMLAVIVVMVAWVVLRWAFQLWLDNYYAIHRSDRPDRSDRAAAVGVNAPAAPIRKKNRPTIPRAADSIEYKLRQEESYAHMTPGDEEKVTRLVARMNQGDTYGYFELLELYPEARYRQRIREIIINHTKLSFEERRRRVNWQELKTQDPARFVRLAVIDLCIRRYAGGSRDHRDDWMSIEFTGQFARQHQVDAGPILNELAALCPCIDEEFRRHWDVLG